VFPGSSPITSPLLLPKRTRSEGPSLHRRYPASAVLRPSPTPALAIALSAMFRPWPSPSAGLPQLPGLPSRRAVPTTPADRLRCLSISSPGRTAFPQSQRGRHPQLHFRDLLRLHSRYGPSGCSPALCWLCHGASIRPVTRPHRPVATMPIDNYMDGSLPHWQSVPLRRTEKCGFSWPSEPDRVSGRVRLNRKRDPGARPRSHA
jgi:hypothetical protein